MTIFSAFLLGLECGMKRLSTPTDATPSWLHLVRGSALRYNSALVEATTELQFQAIDAYGQQEIGVDEARGIVTGTTQVLQVSRQLNETLSLINEWTPDNREQVLNLILQLADSIRQLNQDGVLRIKNETSREALNKTLLVIEAALTAMQGVLK